MSEITAVADEGPLEPRLPGAVSLRHPLVRALSALAFTTGIVDASSFLGLGQTFTANQTGNIVLLAAGIAGSGNLPVVAPLVSLGAFVVGAGFAVRSPSTPESVATSPAADWRSRHCCSAPGDPRSGGGRDAGGLSRRTS